MALILIYRMFTKLLSWTVLCARTNTSKEIEILVLRRGPGGRAGCQVTTAAAPSRPTAGAAHPTSAETATPRTVTPTPGNRDPARGEAAVHQNGIRARCAADTAADMRATT